MNYTAEDIAKAKELKAQGYNYVARDCNGNLVVYVPKPEKDISRKEWLVDETEYLWLAINSTFFNFITWEDSEPTRLDLIIKSETPKYERITKRQGEYYLFDECVKCLYGKKVCEMWCNKTISAYERLRELENKIESGELIFREVEE